MMPRTDQQRRWWLTNSKGDRWGPFDDEATAWRYLFGRDPNPMEQYRHEECGWCVMAELVTP